MKNKKNIFNIHEGKNLEDKLKVFEKLSTGEKIKRYRKCFGMSQKELATAIGVSESTLSKYENNHNLIISPEILKNIAITFSIPAVYLLDSTWWN